MKKYLALATAGAMALAVLATGVTSSQAKPWNGIQNQQSIHDHDWRQNRSNSGPQRNFRNLSSPPKHFDNWNGSKNKPPKNWSYNWNNKNNWKYKKKPHYPHYNNFVAPFFFGFGLGALTAPYWYEPEYAGLTPHQLWCLERYPNTYNPRTNTYNPRPGVIAVCVSPYSGPVPYY